jgi:uncharacterized membrane protein required for colicin V production
MLERIAVRRRTLLRFAWGESSGRTRSPDTVWRAHVDIAGFFAKVNLMDLVVVAYMLGWFVLGFGQGAVRRLVGILTITFSFFLAAQLNVYLGPFLAAHWTQFPHGYSEMIGFGTLFIAGVVAFALIVQGTYKRVAVFATHPIIDEVLGGLLGLVQGGLLLMFAVIILDQFFLTGPSAKDPTELPFLRPLWDAINGSATGQLLHSQLIPSFVALTGFLLPEAIRTTYNR